MTSSSFLRPVVIVCSLLLTSLSVLSDEGGWEKHIVVEGSRSMTAVAGDVTGDGLPDVITDCDFKTRLLVAPDWKEIILDDRSTEGKRKPGNTGAYIHSEIYDIDGDGDLDYVAARYNPGLIVWFEQPAKPLSERWVKRIIDNNIHGIHGLIKGDVDGDGKSDLLATSAQPREPFPESLAWFKTPDSPRNTERWTPHIFAKNDAPGLTHYLGVGDINGDGRLDAATGAKGGPQATTPGEWFAWWEAPLDATLPWKKHLIGDDHPGATNIHPADVNQDGKFDFIASRGHGQGVIWFEAPNWEIHEIDPLIKEPHCLVVRDLDGDGDMDAATCAFGDKVARWYENDGLGSFASHFVGKNQEAYDIRATDMDLDDDLDFLIAGRGSNNVVWYENPMHE